MKTIYPLRILIIDDDKDYTDLIPALIKKKGLSYSVANIPQKGIRMVEQQAEAGLPFDVIFIDYDMQTLNGLETGAKIKKKYPDITLIGVSLYNSPEMRRRFIDTGHFEFFIGKSDDFEKYTWILRMIQFRHREKQQELKAREKQLN